MELDWNSIVNPSSLFFKLLVHLLLKSVRSSEKLPFHVCFLICVGMMLNHHQLKNNSKFYFTFYESYFKYVRFFLNNFQRFKNKKMDSKCDFNKVICMC